MQGFQTPIEEDSFVVDGMGALGNVHSERGLTYYEVALSGHMYVSFASRSCADNCGADGSITGCRSSLQGCVFSCSETCAY